MTRREKLEERIRRRPTPTDVTYLEFARFLEMNGFRPRRSPGTGGSHIVFIFDDGNVKELLTVAKPHGSRRNVSAPYILKAIAMIDSIRKRTGSRER